MLASDTSPDFLTSSVTDIGDAPPRYRSPSGKELRAAARGRYTMHPEKRAAVDVYAKAVAAKKDGPELLMATMNRAQRRQFVAGARAHSKKLKRETLRDGNKLLRKLNAVAEARGL